LRGTKGTLKSTYTLRGDDDDKETLTFHDLSGNKKNYLISPQNIYFQELKHFAGLIQGSSPLLTAENGARNIDVIKAVKASLKSKKTRRAKLFNSYLEILILSDLSRVNVLGVM